MLRNLFKGSDKSHDESEGVDEQRSWFDRLKSGLTKTRDQFLSQLSGLLRVGRRIDEDLMEEIEEILIQSDVGVDTTLTLMDNVRERVKSEGLSDSSELASVLKSEILNLLGADVPLRIKDEKPYTILVLGVNGAGKTTTIGKLASRFIADGHRVLVAAGDTFRAAAEDQLGIWCERAGAELIRGGENAEPASVVFDAIHAAKHRDADVLIVDTAGRLHTKKPLMDELSKIGRVMGRAHTGAPHEVLLVVDGTVGQNALMQAKIFNDAVPITGVVVTKLDGTAKGGIVIAVNAEIGAPVKLIGIGEKLDDLRDFAGTDFVEALFAEETAE
ncbi:signal recognition particle-docking protein FtsY [Candidatus Poribacteria bacterium]|nr:signal recognition particle-docking protein FtsY [Candidatus Poribacteria bacterium]MYA55073.1 signal recognition particle-docking protein FtsY [Candidatus Poribacteria bacterium]